MDYNQEEDFQFKPFNYDRTERVYEPLSLEDKIQRSRWSGSALIMLTGGITAMGIGILAGILLYKSTQIIQNQKHDAHSILKGRVWKSARVIKDFVFDCHQGLEILEVWMQENSL